MFKAYGEVNLEVGEQVYLQFGVQLKRGELVTDGATPSSFIRKAYQLGKPAKKIAIFLGLLCVI